MAGEARPKGTVAGLAQAVQALRAELAEAMSNATEEVLRFELGKVTMEFAVEVSTEVEAHSGVKFWVVDAGARGNLGRTGTHTVTLELMPRTASGRRPEIYDEEE